MTTTSGRSSVSDDDDLLHSLREAQDQLHATGEVLRALGGSASDLDAVMRTVTTSARRLSRGDAAVVYLFDDTEFRLAWSSGVSEAFLAFVREHPVRADRSALVGRVGRDRETQQIADVLADPEYGRTDLQRLGHYRDRLNIGAPMLVDDEVVGVLNLWRNTVSPFSDREVELLTSYAAQAGDRRPYGTPHAGPRGQPEGTDPAAGPAGGPQRHRRFGELESRSRRGPTTIVTHAVALAGADGGFDPGVRLESDQFRVRTTFGTATAGQGPPCRPRRAARQPRRAGRSRTATAPGRRPHRGGGRPAPAAAARCGCGRSSPSRCCARTGGRGPGHQAPRARPRHDETCELLETFASQSSLALANATCTGGWSARARSWPSRAGTSPSSSPRCCTSCGRP